MSRWFNVDPFGNYKGGPPDFKRSVSGDSPEQLAEYAMSNITECFLREIGRHPKRLELELIWVSIMQTITQKFLISK